MNSEPDPWWKHFDKDPHEKIERLVPGADGTPVPVSLARISWAYLDWVDVEYETDSQDFFTNGHRNYNRETHSFDEWMEGSIRNLFLRMEKRGEPRPPFCPAAQSWHYWHLDK